MITYRKRSTFDPPSNCGYYWGALDTSSSESLKTKYPCRHFAKTAGGRDVYTAYIEDSGLTFDVYYVAYGSNMAVLLADRGTYAISRSDVLKMLDSLQPVSVEQLAKNNSDS